MLMRYTGEIVSIYADDLVLATGDPTRMRKQAKKVEQFCTWSEMASAPAKCDVS